MPNIADLIDKLALSSQVGKPKIKQKTKLCSNAVIYTPKLYFIRLGGNGKFMLVKKKN